MAPVFMHIDHKRYNGGEMSGELFTASINALILDLEGRAARVRHSLSVLKHPDSPYAHAHRALLAAYDAALSSLKVHRAAFVSPAVEVPGGATGPQCPICCSPSWPMEGSGSMWCCTRPGCPVSSFVLTDHLPMPAEDVAAAMEAAKVEAVAVPTEVASPLSPFRAHRAPLRGPERPRGALPWLKIPASPGPTTPSTPGGGARRSPPPAPSATPSGWMRASTLASCPP